MYQVTQATISRQQETIDSLRALNIDRQRADSMSARISPELRVLFPQVRDIAIVRSVVSDVQTARLDTINMVLVQYSSAMNASSSKKFKDYLEARLSTSPLTIVSTNELSSNKK